MEFKGTKGEWRVKHDTTHIECENEIISLGGYLRKYDDTRLDGESWLSMRRRTEQDRKDIEDEQAANAKLIAAAPELLKEAINILSKLQSETEPVNGLDQINLEKAINKALK